MKRAHLFAAVLLALAHRGTALQVATARAAETPNIVIVLADDMGYGDPACYNDQSKVPTPNIDRLAGQGLRFTDAHTPSSVCSPTRYGLLTGRYAWRTPLKKSVLWQWDPPLIEPNRLTLPGMLKTHGYHTACIGKWHLGWDWPLEGGGYVTDEFQGHTLPRDQQDVYGKRIDFARPTRGGPTARGFDRYFGDDVPNFPPYCFIEQDRTLGIPSVEKPKAMFGRPGPALPDWDLTKVMPAVADRAVQFIEQQAATPQRPFFLYMPLTAPHTPIAPSEPFIGKSHAGRYGDWVYQVDWTLGQVLDALEKAGAAKNTLVVFTSDNGSPQRDGTNMNGPTGSVKRYGHDPSRPWRGMKADIWEGGHRVPFIARWQGHVPAGKTTAEPIILTDLMRTIAELVGHELPHDAAEDSFDIGSVLHGQRATASQPIRDHLIHHSHNGVFAIRQGDWKLILGRDSGGFTKYQPPADAPDGQLYNLADDPAEQHNRYAEQPEIVNRLSALLARHQSRGRTFDAAGH